MQRSISPSQIKQLSSSSSITTNRRSPSELSTSIQERIHSLSSGYIGPSPYDVENGEPYDEETKSLLSDRGQLTLQNLPSENHNLSESDSIFNADHEDDDSSSEGEEENDPNDIVG